MFIIAGSILILTVAAYFGSRALKIKVCAICAGVSLTWFWMLWAYFAGRDIDTVALAILLGGTVAGSMYELAVKIPVGKPVLLFKTIYFVFGFAAMFSLLSANRPYFFAGILGELVLAYFFLKSPKHKSVNPRAEELEKKLEDCCK